MKIYSNVILILFNFNSNSNSNSNSTSSKCSSNLQTTSRRRWTKEEDVILLKCVDNGSSWAKASNF